MDSSVLFALVAGIIIFGFLGESIFRKTGVPSFIFLILIGMLLGPVFHLVSVNFLSILGPFAELTLLMILFYGGLDMKVSAILKVGWRALLLVILYMGFSITGITFFEVIVLKWPVLEALLFATIIGGQTSTSIIMPLAKALKLGDVTVTTLTLESIINSVIGITLFLALLNMYTAGVPSSAVLSVLTETIIANVTSGVVMGGIFGFSALFIFRKLEEHTYSYVLTIGLVLLTYAAAVAINASGEIAVFTFGVIIGNYALVNKIQKTQLHLDHVTDKLKEFQNEITFLLNTLFFVFLGLTFRLDFSTLVLYFLLSTMFVAILIGCRAIAVSITAANSSDLSPYKGLMTVLSNQGIMQAVLVIFVLNTGAPFGGTFLDLVTYVIVLTNLLTAVAVLIVIRKHKTSFKDFMALTLAEQQHNPT